MNLSLYDLVYIGIGASLIVFVLLVILLKSHHKKEQREKSGVVEKGGVRFTLDDEPVVKRDVETGELEANVTYDKADILLRRGFKYIVGQNNKIKPGKYTLLTTEEALKEFNIRRNGYVRSYEHDSSVILAEGDDLTPINISVILR